MRAAAALVAVVSAGACTTNEARGDDREGHRDPIAPAAEAASPGAAHATGSSDLPKPQAMTAAEVASLGEVPCRWRMTRAGDPVLAYAPGPDGHATVKLDGELVTLPTTAPGTFAAGGLEVIIDVVEEHEDDELRVADLVLRVPGKAHGFRGYTDC